MRVEQLGRQKFIDENLYFAISIFYHWLTFKCIEKKKQKKKHTHIYILLYICIAVIKIVNYNYAI